MRMFSERTQVLLTPAQRRRLEQLATDRQVSIGSLIREAVDAYTAVRSRPARQALLDLLELGAPADDWSVIKDQILRGAGG
jgi:hypothetical protein